MIRTTLALSMWVSLLLCLASARSVAQNEMRYVLAPSGLNLRESADPASKKLSTLSHGAKVTLLAAPASRDMRIDDLPGGMARVSADGKVGYVFDGYLGSFPAPTPNMGLEKYVEMARREGLSVYYETHNYDYDGYFREESGVTLPGANWQEAFLVAKGFGRIPVGLNFPPESREVEQHIENPDKEESAWVDQITVTRDKAGAIQTIYYYLRSEGGGSFVKIGPDENKSGLLIMIGGIAD